MAQREKENITQKSGAIYRYNCNRLEFDEEYIGESARTFGEWLKEHFRAPSPIYDHAYTSDHHTKFDNFSIVGRKSSTIARTIKEAMLYGSMVHTSGGTLESTSCSTPLTSLK